MLRLGLHGLFERGDSKRNKGERTRRNNMKEKGLRYVAWQYHVWEPLPMEKSALLDLLELHLPDFQREGPERAEDLLDEYVEDGVLVSDGPDHYRFVLRSFHEYCLAGWIACESPPIQKADRAAFERMVWGHAAEWDRASDPNWQTVQPWKTESWRNVWPLVAGQLGARGGWLLGLCQIGSIDSSVIRESQGSIPEREQLVRALIEGLQDAQTFAVVADLSLNEQQALDQRLRDRGYAWALGEIGNEVSCQALVEHCAILRLSRWCAACADALGQIGDEAARRALIEGLSDPHFDKVGSEFFSECIKNMDEDWRRSLMENEELRQAWRYLHQGKDAGRQLVRGAG